MSYAVVVSRKAFDGLKNAFVDEGGVPLEVIAATVDALTRLAENPVELGRKPLIPYPGNPQVYAFSCTVGDVVHRFAALFSYGQNENTLFIHAVRHERMVL